MNFKEGDRIVTCGRSPGFHACGYYYATKVYEARPRKKDGVLTWRLVETLNIIPCGDRRMRGDFPSPAALKLARTHAKENGLPYVSQCSEHQWVESMSLPKPRKLKGTAPAPVPPPLKGRLGKVLKYIDE